MAQINKPTCAPRGSAMTMTLAGIALASVTLLALIEGTSSSQGYTHSFVEEQGNNYASRGFSELAISDIWGGYQAQGRTEPALDFMTFLNRRYTWTPLASGVDTLADKMRQGDDLIEMAVVNGYDNVKLGKRVPTKFNLYRRTHDVMFPNTTQVKQRNLDIMVAAESQRDMGFATPHDQAKSFRGIPNAAQSKREVAHANWVGQYLTFSNPPNYKGLEYGLLTKNVQCTFCHLHVSSVEKSFNKDPAKFNTFPKVKIGSTNLMGINSYADTVVEGTILQRGSLEDDSTGNLISPATAAARLRSFMLNPDGTIKQNSSGYGTQVVCSNTSSTSGGEPIAPAAGGNFYANYATAADKQTEGVLPDDDFPSPFPELPRASDNNRSNHKIDSDEIVLARSDATATSNPALPGSVKGGVALTLAQGTQYTNTTLPGSGAEANILTGHDGNVILTGSSTNPIKVDGKVVIDGDVIIRGYVQGAGQIHATGNIYILGDVIYKNKFSTVNLSGGGTVVQENFGIDSNNKTNLLGLVAGKNIVVGDYLSQVTHWNSGSGDNTNPEFFKPRRLDENDQVVVEQGKAEPGRILTLEKDRYLNPSAVTILPGKYKDLPTGKWLSTTSQPNFTMFQLGMFNQLEYTKTLQRLPDYGPDNPYDPKNASAYRVDNNVANNPKEAYDPDYIPRFYSFYKYDDQNPKTNPIYVSTTGHSQSPINGGYGGAWNTAEKRWKLARHSGDPVNFTDLADIPAAVQSPASLNKKVVVNIHPDWISPDTMMKIISSEEKTRQTGTRRIDGLLYTNNAMLAVERSLVQTFDPNTGNWSNQASRGNGNLQVNGAVIAPDMGVIVPNGQFNVNYDQRVASLLNLSANTTSAAVPANGPAKWSMIRKGFSKFNGSMPTQVGADDDDGNHGTPRIITTTAGN